MPTAAAEALSDHTDERLVYTPETVKIASEHVYQEVGSRLDVLFRSGRYEFMQEHLGVRPASLVAVASTDGIQHLRADLTTHTYNSSYKIHGAANAVLAAREANPRLQAVYAASAGNHGEAVAAVGSMLGLMVTVSAARDASPAKVKLMEDLKATVNKTYHSLPDALIAAEEAGNRENSVFIHPYNDYDVLAGQSLIGVQLVDDLLKQGATGRVVIPVPVGGGGLISGLVIGSRFARECAEAAGVALPFELEFHGVQMEKGDPARRAVERFRRGLPHKTLADLFPRNDASRKNDGTFAIPGNLTLATLADSRWVQSITTVSKAQVGEAMRAVTHWLHKRNDPKMVEPAGALSDAWFETWHETLAMNEPITVVSLVTGANVTLEHYDYFVDAAAAACNERFARLGAGILATSSGVVGQSPLASSQGRQLSRVWSSPTPRTLTAI